MKYVIFGPGRVGTNMAAYLESLHHDVTLLSRRTAEAEHTLCRKAISNADVVAAALPDSKLGLWHEQWADDIGPRPAIHFSGALSVAGMSAFHPLYSFPQTLLSPSIYPTIGFACPEKGPSFEEIFPGAVNPTFKISDTARSHYHALAVLSGNFAAHLWNETALSFSDHYGAAPEDFLTTYFTSLVDRFRENPLNSMTGPAARRDQVSVKANLAALSNNDNLSALYRAFLSSAWPDFQSEDETPDL